MVKKLSGVFAVLCAASLYGALNSIVKLAYKAGFSFSQITYSQYVYGAIGLILLTIITMSFRKVSLKMLLRLSVVGVVGLGGTSLFLYASLREVPTAIALVLLFQFTWISILIERFFLKKRIQRKQIIAVLCVIVGTLCVLQITSIGGEHWTWVGILTGFLAAICYAVFLVGASVLPSTIPHIYMTTIMVVVNVVVFTAIFLPVEPFHAINPFTTIWMWGIVLGVMGQFLPPLLFTYGAPIIGGTSTSILSSVELPVGVLVSSLMIHDPVSLIQWIGVIFILGGIVVSSIK